jgi:hypothetical protein
MSWKIVSAICNFALTLIIGATLLTIWAHGKSVERTACYKTANAASDCEQPGPLESVVRAALTR